MEYVSIVASGYEFVCPVCNHYNKIVEATEILECERCKKKFLLGEIVDAIG